MKKSVSLIILFCWVNSILAQNWAEIQSKTIRFYRYQRAGLKGAHCHNPYYEGITSNWPHQNDNYNGHDLSGGWYDAGDFVKFGLPFSSTVYILLKGYDIFPNGYSDNDSWDKFNVKDDIPDILNEVKFATDYILKAVINSNTVVYDVGDGDADHACNLFGCGGPTNSSSVGHRPARLADGADVPGLYAASLALMSQLYRKYDSKYADSCLSKAKEAYEAGWARRSKGVSSQFGPFYNSSRTPSGFIWHDKLMAGAVELYRATKEKRYLDDLKTLSSKGDIMFNNIGYTNVGPIVSFEMWRQNITTQANSLKDHISWLESKVINNPSRPQMHGVYYNQHWGMVGGAACAAFAAALAYIVDPEERYKEFAEKQLSWICGASSNSRSWIVGYNGGPTAVHHRNAIWKGILPEGALVSGPDSTGNYVNNAEAYEYTEVALDYNAGIPGAIAFLRDLNSSTSVKINQALASSNYSVSFATTPSVTLSAKLDKAAEWKLVLTGDKSGAVKTFSGNSSSISQSWDGSADEGNFVAGDQVTAQLQIENLAVYHTSRASVRMDIINIKIPPFKATDILVDDFDDADFVNKQGGVWSLFNDSAFGGKSTTYPLSLSKVNKSTGESGLGFMAILYTEDKIEHPFSGIRMTFDKDGKAVSLGKAKSIVFDYKGSEASVGSSFVVEIEQSDIPDSAYYGQNVTIPNTLWNRVRIPLTPAALSVREWKTSTVPFSTNSVTALRIVNYESESVNITLDSLHIEELEIGDPISVRDYRIKTSGAIINRSNCICIPLNLLDKDNNSIEILNVQGKRIKKLQVNKNYKNQSVEVKLNPLSNGLYLVRILKGNKETITVPVMVSR